MKSTGKQAVVVIHGIGNQYPMQTVKNFVENLKDKNDILYNTPDKEANIYETRRLSLSNKNTDFFEYYWANLMTEPSTKDLYAWMLKLIFLKKPSERIKKIILKIRLFLTTLILLLFTVIYFDIITFMSEHDYVVYTGSYSIVVFILFKFVFPNVESKVVSSLGDAMKYLTPTPINIESRYKIRKRGIELLKNLHEKKNDDGQPFYDRITVVGHSLGSIIAYDLITHFWYENMYSLNPGAESFSQKVLGEVNQFVCEYEKHKKKKDYVFDYEKYKELQSKLFKELKTNESAWRISDLVTIGSPLCHGDFLMANNRADFRWKLIFREFPLSPPLIEMKLEDNKIVKDFEKGFIFSKEIKDKYENKTKVKIINHSSLFSFIRWTNIYFKNDQIGGNLTYYFGHGIKNIEIKPKGGFFKKNLPVHSHTDYWNKTQEESINEIKKILY